MARRNYNGKTVIVTGAARGLGKALCRRFGRAGARIGALDVLRDELDTTCDELRSDGVAVASAVADLRDETATLEAISSLRKELGAVDVLINNAGITHVRNFDAGESAAVRRVMEVNFFGSVHATAAAFDDLVTRHGQIVVVSSVAGFAPLVARTSYSASKHALHGFFGTLRAELREQGVDVLIVCPSFIATNISDEYFEDGSKRRPLGGEDTAEKVATQIFHAAERSKRLLTTGLLGSASYWVVRFAPWLYDRVMRKTMRKD